MLYTVKTTSNLTIVSKIVRIRLFVFAFVSVIKLQVGLTVEQEFCKIIAIDGGLETFLSEIRPFTLFLI